MPDVTIIAPPPPQEEQTSARGQTAARVFLALAFFLLGLWTIKSFLPALVWAGVFAIALWPLYRRAMRTWPRQGGHGLLMPALFTAGVALLFLIPLILLGAELAREAHGVSSWLEAAQQNGVPVPAVVQHLPWGSAAASAWWQQNLAHPHPASGLADRLNHAALMQNGREIGAAVARRMTLFALMLLTLFVLFREGHALTAQLRAASRRAFGPQGERVGGQIIASVHGTVTGLVLVGLAEGVALGVAFAVAGVPHPALLGAAAAVLSILPFGAYLAVCLASLLLLATSSVLAACALLGFGAALSFAVDHFVRPVLIGGATKLPFLWVLLGLLGGLEVWGLLGLFLGPAVMAALIMLWRDFVGETGRTPHA